MKNNSSVNPITQTVTALIHTIQVNLNFQSLRLKQGAKVPKIYVKNGEDGREDEYPLIGDRYIIGRSSQSCDIVVRNPVISQIHSVVEKKGKNKQYFEIKDQNSTNGIYKGHQRYDKLILHHGDVITLGPPELKDAVEIRYDNPAPKWLLAMRYGLYGGAGLLGLLILWLGWESSQYQVYPLPHGVSGPVIIYSGDGKTNLSPKIKQTHRELDKLSDFSDYLPQALLASEDSRYYWHFGVDPLGILRAVLINSQEEGIKQGASTITQQLARSLFPAVGRENTLQRKWKEMLVAFKLEAIYSKDEILKTYLNRVYLGVNSYGFEDASRFYFDKSAADLTLEEAATLVAILPAPNAYNPVQDYDTAVALRNRVLDRMWQLGMIDRETVNNARRSRIEISPKAKETFSNVYAPYFYSYVFQELGNLLGDDLAKEGDFIVETGINLTYQKHAEQALKEKLAGISNAHITQGAIVTLNSKTGEILALVGGKDFQESQFNRATQAKRQPGSTFKVFAYAAALERGISPYTHYSCAPLRWQGMQYKPCERTSGSADMYRGLAQSENAIALRVAKDVGLSQVVAMAKKLGVKSPLQEVPGVVLGQSEATVLEMTGAYGAFANEGRWTRPHAIKVIRDGRDCQDFQKHSTCRIIYQFNQGGSEKSQAISQKIASTMTAMMRQAITSGTGGKASLGKGEAGKTGTTNKGVDLWFIGYVPTSHLVTGIWLGNDDNSPTNSSSFQAADLWGNYMSLLVN